VPYRIDVDAKAANHDQFVSELNALAIPGIRAYTIIGRPGEVVGVYPWSDAAPEGEFRHIDEEGFQVALSDADRQRIVDAIAAHVPKGDPDVAGFLAATMMALGQARARKFMRLYPDVVRLFDSGRYWAAARQGIDDALAEGALTQQEYDQVVALLDQYNIPTENKGKPQPRGLF